MEVKLIEIEKRLKQLNIKFEKIFVISSFRYSSSKKNFKFVKANKSLKIDLKNIYKISKKIWSTVNFNFYINIQANINFKTLKDLNTEIVYNNYESITLAEKVKENFIINHNGQNEFRSTSLEPAENKPAVTLLRWSRGCIVDPDYLRRGILFTDNSYVKFI